MSAAALVAWLQANPLVPAAWRELTLRAVDSPDPDLWPAGVKPVQLYGAACHSLDAARRETARQAASDEAAALDAVQRAIAALRAAIEHAPLPRGSATLCELAGPGLPRAMLMIGWRDVPDELLPGAYSTSVVDVLGLADELLRRHREAQPARVVERQRDRPEAVAFVRLMAGAVDVPAATLAAWCNVALGQALTGRDVRAILRRRPRGT